MSAPAEHVRMVEALLFAAAEPLDEASLRARLPEEVDLPATLGAVAAQYACGGVNLVEIAGAWSFRTAPDLRHLLERYVTEPRRLSRAALETLAIVAYHQPVTRGEMEEIRGVALSKGTLDALLGASWIKPKGRRQSPGRPVTYGTTGEFLEHFGIDSLSALPGLDELQAAGVLEPDPPPGFLRDLEEHAITAVVADVRSVDAGEAPPDTDSVIPLRRP